MVQAIANPVLAHRGGNWDGLVENSMANFRRAFDERVDGIEFDLHATADGHVVVHHDAYFTTADGRTAQIADTNLADLPLLADGSTVPTFDDLLALRQQAVAASGGTYRPLLDTELKVAGLERRVLDAYDRHGILPGDAVVTSFVPEAVGAMHEIAPWFTVGLLVDAGTAGTPTELVASAQRLGATMLAPHYSMLSEELLEAASAAHVGVVPWTVNDAKLLATGVRDARMAAVITDFPKLLRG